jgi:hypothetical protein
MFRPYSIRIHEQLPLLKCLLEAAQPALGLVSRPILFIEQRISSQSILSATLRLKPMVARVEVRPDEQLTARFPKELAARITVRTKDQRVLVKEHLGYEGGLDQPMSWERVVEKFHWLSEAFAEEDLRNRLIQAVQQLDLRPISALTDLLAQVRPTTVFPRTHPGIQ